MKTIKERYTPNIPNLPYLTPPLKNYNSISEGFIYSKSERDIHGNYFHKGIDYECNYGESIYACASGYAIAGYHRFVIRNKDGSIRLYKGKPISNGLGYFVQIFHKEKVCGVKGSRITQYGHMSKFSKLVTPKLLPPIQYDLAQSIVRKNDRKRSTKLSEGELKKIIDSTKKIIKKYPWVEQVYGFNFKPEIKDMDSYLYTLKELEGLYKKKDKCVTWVNQGDLIGYVGTSAVVYGDMPYEENVSTPNIKEFNNTWDEVHLHFEEAGRDEETRAKVLQRDVYGVYKGKRWYGTLQKSKSLFENPRLLT